MAGPVIALAGAGGDLGSRIARALAARGAQVRALVRPGLDASALARVSGLGANSVAADPIDMADMARALEGAACAVSALNGLAPVILDRQGVLLDAAVAAGVPRLIPSDFSEDFTRTTPGRNRNLDLRREFMARADAAVAGGASLRLTSILNGAFMDMLGAEMPIIQPRLRRVLFWRSADQPLDFTTKDDVASFTAAVALDDAAPRILRLAGSTVTVRQIAAILREIDRRPWRPLYAGGLGALGLMIRAARLVAPGGDDPFPAWQGMAYMRDMFSGEGRLAPLDSYRYPDLAFTSVRDHLVRIAGSSNGDRRG